MTDTRLFLSVPDGEDLLLSDLIRFVDQARALNVHPTEVVLWSIEMEALGLSVDTEPIAEPADEPAPTAVGVHIDWSVSDADTLDDHLHKMTGEASFGHLAAALKWPMPRLENAWAVLVGNAPMGKYTTTRHFSGAVTVGVAMQARSVPRCEYTWNGSGVSHVHRCKYGRVSDPVHSDVHVCDVCGAVSAR